MLGLELGSLREHLLVQRTDRLSPRGHLPGRIREDRIVLVQRRESLGVPGLRPLGEARVMSSGSRAPSRPVLIALHFLPGTLHLTPPRRRPARSSAHVLGSRRPAVRLTACVAQEPDSRADWRFRTIPRHALRALLRDHRARSADERDLLGYRSRGARPAPRARRASPADQAPEAASEGQAVPLGDEQDAASGTLAGVHRDPGHAGAMAPRARSAQVDVSASASPGPPAHRPRDQVPDPARGKGEPPLGARADQRASSKGWASSSRPPRSARSFVAPVSGQRRDGAGPTWREFHSAQAKGIVACDFLTVERCSSRPCTCWCSCISRPAGSSGSG